jgi:hypothetical protein
MPPSSSTSSSRARRGAVVTGAFALALATILLLSLWRLDHRGLARTREDQVVHQMSQMRGVHAEAIVLADSVTAGAAFLPKPAPGVYPMLTNGYLRIVGNYFMFRRFLEHNTTKNLYFFMVPSMLSLDVSNEEGDGFARYTYVDTIFTRPDEIRMMEETGATPQRKIVSIFERLLKAWYPNRIGNPFALSLFHVEPVERAPEPYQGTRVAPATTPQIRFYLDRFQEDCRSHNVNCVMIQAPTLRIAPRFDMKAMQKLYPGLTWIDFHDYATFPDEAFPDKMHLDRRASIEYVRLIQTHIAPIFSQEQPAWTGGKVLFSTLDGMALFFSEDYHNPEPWGLWTSAASVRLRFKTGSELRDGEFRVSLQLPPDPRSQAPWPVSIALDGAMMLETPVPPDGRMRELVFKTGQTTLPAGTLHALDIRIPQTLQPKAVGLNTDTRQLGVGLGYIAYCGPHNPCGG